MQYVYSHYQWIYKPYINIQGIKSYYKTKMVRVRKREMWYVLMCCQYCICYQKRWGKNSCFICTQIRYHVVRQYKTGLIAAQEKMHYNLGNLPANLPTTGSGQYGGGCIPSY